MRSTKAKHIGRGSGAMLTRLTFVIEGLPGSISGLKAARNRAAASNNSNSAQAISTEEIVDLELTPTC